MKGETNEVQRRNAGQASRGQECPLVVGSGARKPLTDSKRRTVGRGIQRARRLFGLHEMVWVSGQERSDWRVSGAITLTSDETAARFAGAVRLDAG